MTVTVLSSHRITEPAGSMGGGAGKCGENMIARQDGALEKLEGNDAAQMSAGDVFIMHTPGGGGYFAKS